MLLKFTCDVYQTRPQYVCVHVVCLLFCCVDSEGALEVSNGVTKLLLNKGHLVEYPHIVCADT